MISMDWLIFAILAYFLIAVGVILDKFLLSSKRVSHPANYAFYSGALSAFAFFFSPLGFHWAGWERAVASVFSGIIFVYGILALFYAINKNEASRVTPVVGAVTPIGTFVISWMFFGEGLNLFQLLGVTFLISGGLLISFNFSGIGKGSFFSGFSSSISAGLLLAVAFLIFDRLFLEDNFWNVYIWTRLGLVLGAFSLLAFPSLRIPILKSLSGFRKNKRNKNRSSAILFVLVKILAGVSSVILNYAISLGNVTVINAMISVQYVFIFIFGFFLSSYFPVIFQEKRTVSNFFQKIGAIIIIFLGLFLSATRF